MTPTFDSLANHYDRGRIGYSSDIYNTLVGYGLNPRHAILDIGCGTGLASGPLIDNDFRVTGVDPSEPMLAFAKRHYPTATWVPGTAEKLPFENASFDSAISAQVFHRLDRNAALAEMQRVLRPGGIAAIWFKSLVTGDAVKYVRESVAADFGANPISVQHPGFKEFYGVKWSETSLRVLPWRTSTTLMKFLEYERSRAVVREKIKDVEGYIGALEQRLRETFGPGDPLMPLSYSQYLYLAKK